MTRVSTNQVRLNQLFDADPRNDSAIGEALGVSKQTISAWRNGTRSPKRSMLTKIAQLYHTSEEWLLGWDMPAPVAGSVLSQEEERLLTAYRAAEDTAQRYALEMLLAHPRADAQKNRA